MLSNPTFSRDAFLMNSAWNILGLGGPTQDQRAIKKAYAKKLKVTRPDDDADAFMALRDAYAWAKDYAAYYEHHDVAEVVEADTYSLIETEHANHAEPYDETYEKPVEHVETETEPVMVTKIRKILGDPWKRNNKKSWKTLFEDPDLEPIDAANDFEGYLLWALLQDQSLKEGESKADFKKRSRFDPVVATYIFSHMGWHEPIGRNLQFQDHLNYLRRKMDVLNKNKNHLQNNYFYSSDSSSDAFKNPIQVFFVGLVILWIVVKIVILFADSIWTS